MACGVVLAPRAAFVGGGSAAQTEPAAAAATRVANRARSEVDVWCTGSLDGWRPDSLLSMPSQRPCPPEHAHFRPLPRPRRACRPVALFALCTLGAAGCRNAPAPSDTGTASEPPAAQAVSAPHVKLTPGVAAANPIAVEAGLEVLRAGGGAADAAVAVQAALGLVEPQSSGLGGGAFLLYYDAQTGTITAFDGRETAPAGATPGMFLDENGAPLSYQDAVTSGRSTGVPGAVAMLGLVHSKHGRLPWKTLFDAPIRAAEQGFVVPQRLGRFANSTFAQATLPDARALFSKPDGTIVQAGDTLRNPAYARNTAHDCHARPACVARGPARGTDRRAHARRAAPRHVDAAGHGGLSPR